MFGDDETENKRTSKTAQNYLNEKLYQINGKPIQGSKKEYIALLRGDWKRKFGDQKEVIVDKPLNVKGITKDAKTVFKILSSTSGTDSHEDVAGNHYSPAACSLVLCTPLTGRTHQIRRHAYAMGCPIIGDSEHGDSKINRWWRQNRDLNRLFLHCLSLDLPPLQLMEHVNTNTGETSNNEEAEENPTEELSKILDSDRVVCTAPLTEDLAKVLNLDDLSDVWQVAKKMDHRLQLAPYDERGGTFGRNYQKKKLDLTNQGG